MANNWLLFLEKFVDKKGLVFLKLEDEDWYGLCESRRGANQFTMARPHHYFKDISTPSLCLLHGTDDHAEQFYLGILSSRGAVTTFDTRVKFKRGVRLKIKSLVELQSLITDKRHSTYFNGVLKRKSLISLLPPKFSRHLIKGLHSIKENHGVMRNLSDLLSAPKSYSKFQAQQQDALFTSLRAFGIASDDQAVSLSLVGEKKTALSRIPILEDAVIEHDARSVPGYDLVGSEMTGRALFERADEKLEVFTANKRDLEKVFGVDLIYYNQAKQNIVMLQYKMLEADKEGKDTDWIYRPNGQFKKEIARMELFLKPLNRGDFEYRINPQTFYLKFVKRDGNFQNGSIIIPLDHFNLLEKDPKSIGKKGGLRVSYNALMGRYLRNDAFLGLLRSGYIGAYAEATEVFKALIELSLSQGKAVVAALQSVKETTSRTIEDDLSDAEDIENWLNNDVL